MQYIDLIKLCEIKQQLAEWEQTENGIIGWALRHAREKLERVDIEIADNARDYPDDFH